MRIVFFHLGFLLLLPANLLELCTLAGWGPVKITINRDKLIGFKN
jgi:hypothetical protein